MKIKYTPTYYEFVPETEGEKTELENLCEHCATESLHGLESLLLDSDALWRKMIVVQQLTEDYLDAVATFSLYEEAV